MNFNKHSHLAGAHSFLSASKYHWSNYDDLKLDAAYRTAMAAARGTALHEFAHTCILLRERLPRNTKTLNMYVNDAIGFRMTPEVVLYYSDNCFGTADAISFRNNMLRISDLKTGATPTSMRQLEIYAAMFCLEYRVKPADIGIELRIYQNDDIKVYIPDMDMITHLMDTIVRFDKRINAIKEEEEL